ncbi:alpha/beta fold hydrolase [Bradyrhizobium sp. CCGUVB23]|uniref:alpha/beta fold hydrolase n=1 Tax=Bradyrhizobium sp. CCGUVB23 TaxID=2949630 RepID=UPI0020B1FDCA|nr:alpha/beta hydrolase [Bradyrhizobium sp. CCGUVB23]MCP3464066.1 alpha/beta hydrolase [Bradyrhizobium sp. CCGUVB23]
MFDGSEEMALRVRGDRLKHLQPDREDVVQGLSPSGFHQLAYTDWGPLDDKRPIICVHGLTRQGRDFDHLAERLVAAGRRVICPDLPGRGRSGWIGNPDHYTLPQYCADMNALIARLGVSEVDWVGTSLGGLIGMIMAGFSGSMVRRLVINDIGPFVSSTGLQRIGQYIGNMPALFKTIEEAETYFRTVLAPYGKLADEHWRHLTEHSVRWDDGRQRYALLCDPAIAKGFRLPWFAALNLWDYWEAIKVPVLVLRGKHSDLLSFDLAAEMRKRNRMANVFHFDDCGHVPPLMAFEQIDVVTKFLLSNTISGWGERNG